MSVKKFSSAHKINLFVWQFLCLAVSTALYIAILENRSPNILRSLSISLRTSFGVVVLLTTLGLYLVYRIPGRIGQLAGMAATLALFALALAGVWASGHTQSILISGLIPVSDATGYYIDANRILYGTHVSNFSAMRPLFPGFLAFLLSLTGRNLMSAVGILTALAGLAAYIASREIQKTHGTEPAIIFLMSMFLYFRHHSGTTLSESLAVTVSLLGIALIWLGKNRSSGWITLFGIGVMAFALNIRPGAMFVLPALLLWGGWYFRGDKRFSFRFFLVGTALITFVFYLNNLMIDILGGPDGVAFQNFSWAVYGLASGGKSWTYIFQAHPEVFFLNAEEQNRAIYKLTIELILQNPALLIQGALQYWKMFFSNTWYNAYSFVAGNNYHVNEVARWSMYFLCGMGVVKWWKDRKDEYASLVLLAGLGVLASVPFVPPTDAYRVRLYAATIPFFGLLPAMGVAYLRDRLGFRLFPKSMPEAPQITWMVQFSILLLVAVLTTPILIKTNSRPPHLGTESCPSEFNMITIRYDPGTYVNVARESTVFLDWMPNFHVSDFRRGSHSLADINLIQAMETIAPPRTLFYTLDIQTNKETLVIIRTDELPKPGQLVSLCGQWDDDPNVAIYGVFHADFMAEK